MLLDAFRKIYSASQNRKVRGAATSRKPFTQLHLELLEHRTNPTAFAEPVSLSSLNGVLEITLRAHESTQTIEVKDQSNVFAAGTPTQVDGFLTYAWAIKNGIASNNQATGDFYPSPTLKVNPGDTLIIHLENNLTEPTNIHTHGLEISPLGNSDNIILSLASGQQNVFEYHIPSDEAQGAYWYHSHEHEYSQEQVYRGMAGFLIVGRADSDITEVATLPTRLMMLQNQTIKLNAITGRYELLPFNITDPASQFTVNGQYMPDLQMAALDEVWVLLQVDPTDLSRTYTPSVARGQQLSDYHIDDLGNETVYLVGQDGHAFPKTIIKDNRTALAPGKRSTEVHPAPPAAGPDRYFAVTALAPSLNPPDGKNQSLTQPLIKIHGFGAGDLPSTYWNSIPKLNSPYDFVSLASLPVDIYRDVVFEERIKPDGTPEFLINGEIFPNPPIFRPRLGTLEEWKVINADSPTLPHPIHVHLTHFQGQIAPGEKFPPPHPYDQDVWYIEQAKDDPTGTKEPSVIRMKFESFTGLTVFHCHNLFHEDKGMMALMDVLPSVPIIAIGASAGGGPEVKILNSLSSNLSTQQITSFFAFESGFTGGVEVSVADVNNDSISDVIVGAGPGGGPRVRVFDGATNFTTILYDFFAFAGDFSGGVSVAGGDFNADGFADIAVGAKAGGGPNVRIFDGRTGVLISDFFAYSPDFSGGVSLAAGALDKTGVPSLITGAGPGGGSHVIIWKNSLINSVGDAPIFPGTINVDFKMIGQFFAYEASYNGGVQVALGYNGGMSMGGFMRILTGTMSEGPRVTVWEVNMNHGMDEEDGMLDLTMVNTFFVFDSSVTTGVCVGSIGNSTGSDLIVSSGAGAATQFKRFSFGPGAATPALMSEMDPFSQGFSGGASVGGTL